MQQTHWPAAQQQLVPLPLSQQTRMLLVPAMMLYKKCWTRYCSNSSDDHPTLGGTLIMPGASHLVI